MAAYNVAPYIDEAIQSVLRQNGVSFELLIGDDASVDGTFGRICAYARDPRIRFWRFREHHGAGFVWNGLVEEARGECLLIFDADDLILPGYLGLGASILERKPEVGVVFGDHWVVEGSGGKSWLHRAVAPRQMWDLVGIPVWNPGTFIRRSILKKVGGYSRAFPFMLDYDLFLRLAEITQFHPMGSKRPLYLYRRRRGSMSDRRRQDQDRVVSWIRSEAILRRYGYRVPW